MRNCKHTKGQLIAKPKLGWIQQLRRGSKRKRTYHPLQIAFYFVKPPPVAVYSNCDIVASSLSDGCVQFNPSSWTWRNYPREAPRSRYCECRLTTQRVNVKIGVVSVPSIRFCMVQNNCCNCSYSGAADFHVSKPACIDRMRHYRLTFAPCIKSPLIDRPLAHIFVPLTSSEAYFTRD